MASAETTAPVGRADERARLEATLARASTGRVATLLLVGQPGMGRSTLLDEIRSRAERDGFRILATRGRPTDAEIGFASLLTLLRPVEDELEALAGDLAAEVRSALALGRTTADPVAVRLGVFRVLAGLAQAGPVLLAVDDAHHLDAATADVLAFALGRLDADPVAAVLTGEEGADTALGDVVEETIHLEPLDDDAMAVVARSLTDLADDVLRRCRNLASGNPLVLLELLRSLNPRQRRGDEALPVVLRPPAALAQGFEAALAAAPDIARRALVVVAADDTGEVETVAAALGRLGEPDDALSEAEAAGVLVVEGSLLRLTHPLLRAVAYHQVAPASRRAAHRALAAVLAKPHQAAGRAWQLAAAAEGTDEDAAAALALVAEDASRRGGPASAARTLERAASLTPDPARRAERLIEAARRWLEAVDLASAQRVVQALDRLPVEAAAVAASSAVARWTVGEGEAAARLRRAVGQDQTLQALLADAQLAAGDPRSAASTAAPLAAGEGSAAELARAVLVLADGLPAGELGARDATTASDVVDTRLSLRRAEALVVAGLADEALAELDEPLPWDPVEATVLRARALVLKGDADAAANLLHQRLQLLPVRAERPRAVLEAAAADVAWLLTPADDDTDIELVSRTIGALADPLPAARRLLADAVASGDPDAFARAAEQAEGAGLVVEAARARIGEADRAAALGSDDRARTAASAAAALLAPTGVVAWRRRIERHLAGVAAEAPDEGPDLEAELSPAEHRVAVTVGSGKTNKETAETLFLSVKTVDFHLQNIYRKLGLRSRTELAVLVSRGAGEPTDSGV